MSMGAEVGRHILSDMGTPMRILFVSLAAPLPQTNGHRVHNLVLLRARAGEGHRVSLVSFADSGETGSAKQRLGEICQDVTLVAARADGRGGDGQHLTRPVGLKSPRPYGVWRFALRALADIVSSRLARGGLGA